MTTHRRNQLAAMALVIFSAVVRLPFEEYVTHDLRQRNLLPEKIDASLRDKMTQEAFIAYAGGLRSMMASYKELEAFSAWENEPPRWEIVDQKYALACQLQPRGWHYWEMHTWMLAQNAAEYYATDHGSVQGLEAHDRQYYQDRGLAVCEKGILQNKDTFKGYRQAADMLANDNRILNPQPNYEKASYYYLKASECEDAQKPPAYPTRYLYRFHLFCMAQLPDKAQEAYTKLRKLYESSAQEDFPTTRTWITKLETVLNIPVEERCKLRTTRPR
jgi:hypothetical protein